MDKMMTEVKSWLRDPASFLAQRGLPEKEHTATSVEEKVFLLIVEGFLIFNFR